MARAYFYVIDQGPHWTVRYENRSYGMFASESAAYSQAAQWARDQGKEGHDGQVFVRADNGRYRARWSFARDPYPPVDLNPAPDPGAVVVPLLPSLLAALIVALVLAPYGVAAEDAAAGTVRICRQNGIADVYTGKPINIPAGASFVDQGALRDAPVAGDTATRTRIATTEAAQIAADASCIVAQARISQSAPGAALHAADNKRLAPSRAAAGGLPGWPGNLYLVAIVASDFR